MSETNEAWEEEQMSNLGCESVSDLIAEVLRLREEVKRLRDLVEFAIATIDSNHCYMGEEAQVDLRDYLKEMKKND